MKYIYLIRKGNICKIGYSANPKKRLKELQTGNECLLELVLEIQSNYANIIEKILHRNYQNKRLEGEWFELEESDYSEIVKICSKYEMINSKMGKGTL